MEALFAGVIFNKKTKLKAWFLAISTAMVLLLIRSPWPVIKDITQLFLNRDFLRALQSTLWLVNRSFLKINELGLNFRIGEVLSEESCRCLYDSRFVKNSDKESIDKAWLVLAGLMHKPDNVFWQQQYPIFFTGYREKIKIFSTKKPLVKSVKRSVSETDAIKALDDLSALFKNQQAGFFLVSGTFLGLIREQKFLGHDYDIDIGCFAQQFDFNLFMKTLEHNEHFYVKELCYYLSDNADSIKVSEYPYTIKLLHHSYISIDVFIHYREGNQCIHGTGIHLWSNEVFELQSYSFYGRQCLGARDYDKYLSENYGDWRTEKKNFDCDTGTPNLIFPETPQAYLYLLEHYDSVLP